MSKRTVLFGLYGGFSLPVDVWDTSIEAGFALGDHREDGFLALVEMRMGFGWVLPWSNL